LNICQPLSKGNLKGVGERAKMASSAEGACLKYQIKAPTTEEATRKKERYGPNTPSE